MLEHNPIHEDMLAAAKMVNVQFIFNVALDGQKKIIAAWAGDPGKGSRRRRCLYPQMEPVPQHYRRYRGHQQRRLPAGPEPVPEPQAVATAEACAGEDGVIIMCCSCADGMGGTHFEKLITMGTVDEIDGYLSKIPPKETIPEQWCPQIYARS